MNAIQRCKPLLGTYVEVAVQDNVSDKALIGLSDQIFNAIEAVEKAMSFHDKESELSTINRHAHKAPVTISPDMHQVLEQAIQLSALTNGRYDISISPKLIEQQLLPDYGYSVNAQANWQSIQMDQETIAFEQPLILDLGGIAKGFAVDKAIEAARDCETIVNAGGDMRMSHWQGKAASIRLPKSPLNKYFAVPMRAGALASSGQYFLEKNTTAIIDPTGEAGVNRAKSVSVFAQSCMLADALTKVVYLEDDATGLLAKLNASAIQFDEQGPR